ncbi:ARF7 effector protein C-terminus [Porites harrisoni]
MLTRAGVFHYDEEYISRTTVCPKHRYQLGGGWFQKRVCRYPDHTGKAKPDRSINKLQYKIIFHELKNLVPVGSGICTSCRKKLAMLMKGVTANKTDEDEPEVRRSSTLAEKSPVSFKNLFCHRKLHCHLVKSCLLMKPLRLLVINVPFALHRDQPQCKEEDDSLKKLNDFLVSPYCGPVR